MNPIPPALAFLVANFQSFVSVKLDSSNYFAWKTQVEHALKANGFFEYLDPTHVPSPYVLDDSGTQVPNPKYAQWMCADRMLLSCLIATLTSDVLPHVVGSEKYTCQFWIKLEDKFSILSSFHADYLKRGLYNLNETGTRSTLEEGISMDPILYEAAMKGDLDKLKAHADKFDSHLTGNKNTVLHVAAEFGKFGCVEEILRTSPLLFRRTNIYGETPLHFALEGGFSSIAELLINHAQSPEVETEGGEPGAALREMLRARNRNGDSALHLAARRNYEYIQEDVMRLQIQSISVLELDFGPNNAGETPLFLLAESGVGSMLVSQITEASQAVAYGGPGGSTAMHMAATTGDVQTIQTLHVWKNHLIKEADAYGWTPLHFAARYYKIEAIKELLKLDKSLAYVTASNDEGNTALHIAAALGDRDTMKTLLLGCPDCWEVVNKKGQNFLHIAVDMERDAAIDLISKKSGWVRRAIRVKDNGGNTPSHLLASKMKIGRLERKDLWIHTPDVFNNESVLPWEMRLGLRDKDDDWPRLTRHNTRDTLRKDRKAINNWKESIKEAVEQKDKVRKEVGEQTRKSAKDHKIVATLIATISFTASFTVPGGYNSNPGPQQGMAILLRELAFKVFVITNTLTVLSSTSSVFLFLAASLFNNQYEDQDRQTKRYEMALLLTVVAMVAMTVAFTSGTYAMLQHSSGLAIVTCVFSCCAFVVYASEFSTSIRAWVIRSIQERKNWALLEAKMMTSRDLRDQLLGL